MSEQNPEQEPQEGTETDTPEAPVATEPQPVEVSPEPTPTGDVRQDKVLGKDYEVSPDRGYRVVRPDATPEQSAGNDGDNSES